MWEDYQCYSTVWKCRFGAFRQVKIFSQYVVVHTLNTVSHTMLTINTMFFNNSKMLNLMRCLHCKNCCSMCKESQHNAFNEVRLLLVNAFVNPLMRDKNPYRQARIVKGVVYVDYN